jgi:hypothetical protein
MVVPLLEKLQFRDMMPSKGQHIFFPCHQFWFNFDLPPPPLHKTVFKAGSLLNSTLLTHRLLALNCYFPKRI